MVAIPASDEIGAAVVTFAERRARLFPQATDAEWGDWKWQMRHAARDADALARALEFTASEVSEIVESQREFRVAVSPYYLCLAHPAHRFCPVRMQAVPTGAELHAGAGELVDPLGEDANRPVSALVHKYPDRALLLATDACPMYCRHCTRKRITKGGEYRLGEVELAEAIAYLGAHREVREVIVSGGDPLLLSDERLARILAALRTVPHLEILRIGTRVPVTLPMRVTPALAAILRRFAPVFVVTHFNHPKEVTADARRACEQLVDAGIPVENQTVLMRRLNSDARIIAELNRRCLRMRVRPYYLHQMDVVPGGEHLRTPLAKGVEIIAAMRGWMSGLAIPHFAVDLPGGGGKVTLQPPYLIERAASEARFHNYRGEPYTYPDTAVADCACPYESVWQAESCATEGPT